MSNEHDQVGSTTTSRRPVAEEPKKKGSIWKWLLPLLMLAALAVALFFLLGGDVDSDSEGGNLDVDVPETDIDVDAPEIDAELPDVDVEGGDVDVEEGDAEANARN